MRHWSEEGCGIGMAGLCQGERNGPNQHATTRFVQIIPSCSIFKLSLCRAELPVLLGREAFLAVTISSPPPTSRNSSWAAYS